MPQHESALSPVKRGGVAADGMCENNPSSELKTDSMSKTPIIVAIALAALAIGAGAAQADSLPNLGQFNYQYCGPDPASYDWSYGIDGERFEWTEDVPKGSWQPDPNGPYPDSEQWVDPDPGPYWQKCIAQSTKDYGPWMAEVRADARERAAERKRQERSRKRAAHRAAHRKSRLCAMPLAIELRASKKLSCYVAQSASGKIARFRDVHGSWPTNVNRFHLTELVTISGSGAEGHYRDGRGRTFVLHLA
jgi:hypothetical protein